MRLCVCIRPYTSYVEPSSAPDLHRSSVDLLVTGQQRIENASGKSAAANAQPWIASAMDYTAFNAALRGLLIWWLRVEFGASLEVMTVALNNVPVLVRQRLTPRAPCQHTGHIHWPAVAGNLRHILSASYRFDLQKAWPLGFISPLRCCTDDLQMSGLDASDNAAVYVWSVSFEWGVFELRALMR